MSYLDRVFENASEVITIPATQVINFTAGSLKIGGVNVSAGASITDVTATAAEINVLHDVTAGTVTASKGVVVGANKNVDVLAVADLKLGAGAGTSVTSTAAEINTLHDVTAGTVAASKAVVVSADKNIDVIAITDLKLGSGAGTSVTATAAELNLVDDLPATCTLTAAAGTANVSNVTVQAKDAAGTNMARAVWLMVYLSDAATGIGLTGTAASGTVQAKAASGTDFAIFTAKKALLVQTKADGTYILEITDTSKTTYYVCAVPMRGGAPSISAQLTAGSYGA
jgi:hypothetical protein